jgi:uncharacterized protein DUF11
VTQKPLRSAAVVVDINEPDIEVVPQFGEPVPEQSLGTGVTDGEDFTVTNSGFGAPPTTLRITVPDGLDTTFDGPPCCTSTGNLLPPLKCSHSTPGQFECALGPLAHGQGVSTGITFTASASAVPGQPAHHRDTGLARLTSRATTLTPKLAIGHSTVVTVTVHNNGPQPAHVTIAFVILDDFKDLGHFQFTRFDGDTSGDPLDSGVIEWIIGTLEPGKTATAHLTVRSISLGSGHITVQTESSGNPPSCQQKFCGPRLTLTAIAETPTATPAPAATTPTSPPFVPGPGETGDTPRSDSLPTWMIILATAGAALALSWPLLVRRLRRPGRHRA